MTDKYHISQTTSQRNTKKSKKILKKEKKEQGHFSNSCAGIKRFWYDKYHK